MPPVFQIKRRKRHFSSNWKWIFLGFSGAFFSRCFVEKRWKYISCRLNKENFRVNTSCSAAYSSFNNYRSNFNNWNRGLAKWQNISTVIGTKHPANASNGNPGDFSGNSSWCCRYKCILHFQVTDNNCSETTNYYYGAFVSYRLVNWNYLKLKKPFAFHSLVDNAHLLCCDSSF